MQKEMFSSVKNKRAVFQRVFHSEDGSKVLEYLDNLYSNYNVIFDDVNKQYFKLGQEQVIADIKKILKGDTNE